MTMELALSMRAMRRSHEARLTRHEPKAVLWPLMMAMCRCRGPYSLPRQLQHQCFLGLAPTRSRPTSEHPSQAMPALLTHCQ